MTFPSVAPVSEPNPDTGRIDWVLLRGHRLALARAGVIAVALLAGSLFVLNLPHAFADLHSVCAQARRCALTPDQARVLRSMGISLDVVALYVIALAVLFAAVYSAVAALLLWRRSADRMALLSALALVTFATVTFSPISGTDAGAVPGVRWLEAGLGVLGGTSIALFLYLCPDGRFVPSWSRWIPLPFILGQVGHYFLPDTGADYSTWPLPLGFGLFLSGLVPAVGVAIHRYRRVSSAVQRQQTKWVVSGVALAFGIFLSLQVALSLFVPSSIRTNPIDALVVVTATYGVMLLIPLSIGIAILRYRLWDIDLLINRALVYSALTVGVVAFYVLVVGTLGAVLQAHSSLLISVAATGLVAALVHPLRVRLQSAVNRLTYGERDDPYAVLSHLGRRLEGTLAPDAVLSAIVETITGALKLPYAAITLHGDDTPIHGAVSGTPMPAALTLPLMYQGETVGTLILGPRAPGEDFSQADQRLFADLARQAGVAVHTVRLTADLQQARERLVTAREEERRRLRRDLHDGLGPQLGSQTLTLSAARKLLWRDPAAADALLADATTHAQEAILDIRRLVYDLRPPALDDLGLVGALREQAAQYEPAGLRIVIDTPEPLPPLPAAVEVACYRIAQEALSNVVRHAHARTCAVQLTIDEALGLEIRDDGRGFLSDRRAGVGLSSMSERAAELGGSCTIDSVAGHGTRVCARLPLPREAE